MCIIVAISVHSYSQHWLVRLQQFYTRRIFTEPSLLVILSFVLDFFTSFYQICSHHFSASSSYHHDASLAKIYIKILPEKELVVRVRTFKVFFVIYISIINAINNNGCGLPWIYELKFVGCLYAIPHKAYDYLLIHSKWGLHSYRPPVINRVNYNGRL